MVSLLAHDGLRGICACWIMLFHCIIFSKFYIDFQGSSIMPLFFLLSGYSLTVSYSKKFKQENSLDDEELTVNLSPINSGFESQIPQQSQYMQVKQPNTSSFSYYKFLQNRFARVYPIYFLTNLFAFPLWCFGYGSVSQYDYSYITLSCIVSIIPVSTLFCFVFGSNIDGPGWTIATLAIMWMIFPMSLRYIQKYSNDQLSNGIVNMYWLQCVLAIVLFFLGIPFLGFWPAFALSTMNPITRYPVFLMGVYAGELTLRCEENLPRLPYSVFQFFPMPSCCNRCCVRESQDGGSTYWTTMSTPFTLGLVILLLSIALLDAISIHMGGSSLLGAVWLQAIIPYAQLQLIVSLVHEKGESYAYQLFTHPWALWLGKHSMSIYLIHYPIIYYLCWAIHGDSIYWPSCSDSSNECSHQWRHYNEIRTIPLWGIPIVVMVTLMLAAGVYRYIEEPARKLLRTSRE